MRTRRGGGNDKTESSPVAIVSSSEAPQRKAGVSSPLRPREPSLASPTTSNGKKNTSVSSYSIVNRQTRSTRSNADSSPSTLLKQNESQHSGKKDKDIPNEVTPTMESTERQETQPRTRHHLSEAAKENDVAKKNNDEAPFEPKNKDIPSRQRQEFHPTNSIEDSIDGSTAAWSRSLDDTKGEALKGITITRRSNRTAARKELAARQEHAEPDKKVEDEEKPPPKTVAGASRSIDGAVRTTTSLRKHGPNYLDEDTLQRVRSYLTGDSWKKVQVLDDDEVIELMERLYTTAYQLARHRRIAGTGQSDDDTDLGEDTGNDDDDASTFEECLGEEEAHVIGHEFFSEMVSALSTPSDEGSSAAVLDGKTLNWIKRAVGLRRKSSGTITLSQGSNDTSNTPHNPARRVATRRLGRESRADRLQKRKRNLDVLALAIEEIEGELGMKFPVHKARKSQKNARLVKEDDKVVRKKKLDHGSKRVSNKTLQQRVVKRTTQVKAKDGKLPLKTRTNVNGTSKTVKKKGGKVKQCAKESFCTSLRAMDRTWHRLIAQRYPHAIPPPDDVAKPSETAAQFRARQAIPLHPLFVRAGVVHRLPLVHSLAQDVNVSSPSEVNGTPALHTYNVHCHQLWNCLRGLSRRFAQFEFFYSDLDKAWYVDFAITCTHSRNISMLLFG
jgi:hypothetical protein